MNGFGARLADARVAMSLNQAELAALAGVTQVCVSRWESGAREPSLDQVLHLAEVLLVPVQTLLGQQYEHPDTESAVTWWSGWRAGWLACAENVRVASVLDPARMPPRPDGTSLEPDWMRAVHEAQTRGGGR